MSCLCCQTALDTQLCHPLLLGSHRQWHHNGGSRSGGHHLVIQTSEKDSRTYYRNSLIQKPISSSCSLISSRAIQRSDFLYTEVFLSRGKPEATKAQKAPAIQEARGTHKTDKALKAPSQSNISNKQEGGDPSIEVPANVIGSNHKDLSPSHWTPASSPLPTLRTNPLR